LKKTIVKLASIFAILVVLLVPLLLFADVQKYSSVVMAVWLLSAVYFIFSKKKL